MTNKPNKTTQAPLSAHEMAEKLEAARRSPNPAAALLEVAEAIAAVPGQGGRAEEIRFAAKRLEADPFDDVAVLTISTRIDDFKQAAFRHSLAVNLANDPLTVQPAPLVKRSETTWSGMTWDEVQLQNPGIIARPGEIMSRTR
ncbi:hypothetical protein KTF37_29050 [Burkholderia multivorans]|uniref:hypothetical protein n=1 Tax=Burkholderia multivorans TaxID=87883 RepID=UPI001C21A237|nr:hypothetical protein [Burkholderia multivorans]MBU9680900.1 hypothetical protein [Burkholderia multivorans]